MSKIVHIDSASHFSSILNASRTVVVDFYADWCGPCKAIAPMYEQLSQQLSRPRAITFTKVNTDNLKDIVQTYNISAMPTFIIFKSGRETKRIRGADPKALDAAVKQLAEEAARVGDAGTGGAAAQGSDGGGGDWSAFPAPKGYEDITSAVDAQGLDFLNLDRKNGSDRVLFERSRPRSLGSKHGVGPSAGADDWVESDTDEQMMLYIPFQMTVKLHSIHITSLAPPDGGDDAPARPKELRLYKNVSNALGFDEAIDIPHEQAVEIKESDWDAETATAKVDLRFVRFQNISSINIFVVSCDGDGEKSRIDRLRFYGETGQKRAMGKLEKVGEDQ